MPKNLASRRSFLRGSGGFVLGLPFLPSLLGRAEAALGAPRRFVALSAYHGGVTASNLYPDDGQAPLTTEIHPGHQVRHGVLKAQRVGADHVLSAVLRAPATVLTERLIGKLNVMRGFDIPFYIGHNSGSFLGNYRANDQGNEVFGSKLRPALMTIDRLMAWSPTFHANIDGIRERGIVTGEDFRGISFENSNPVNRASPVQKVALEPSSRKLFDRLIAGASSTPNPPVAARKAIVDRVIANYRSLRQSNRRLSAGDRGRLDDHLTRLAELERRLAPVAVSRSCSEFTRPEESVGLNDPDPTVAGKYHGLINDVVAMAFACGTSRIASINVQRPFTTFTGSWHQDIAHQHDKPEPQAMLTASMQKTFELVVLDLAAKLDAIADGPGASVLDNTLLQWSWESGTSTHTSVDAPVITFGGAGGFFRTGQFVDYRSRDKKLPNAGPNFSPGLSNRQWLATALQAMGIPRAEFETPGETGYGDPFIDPVWKYSTTVHPNVIARASDPLPIVTA